MSELFNNNRKTSRLQNWNYGWKGLYFVTVNTKFGENYLGEINNDIVYLNDIGKEVEKQWLLTPSIRPDMNLLLDEFIVMPNHFHGIIGIGRNEFNIPNNNAINGSTDSMHAVRTTQEKAVPATSRVNDNICSMKNLSSGENSFGPQRKNLGSIMRGFKSSVTSWCRINHQLFDWHSRYHDVLIQNDIVLEKIRKYIRNNPQNWKRDRFWK